MEGTVHEHNDISHHKMTHPPKQKPDLKAGPFTGRKSSLPARTSNRSASPLARQRQGMDKGAPTNSSFPTISPLRSRSKSTDIFPPPISPPSLSNCGDDPLTHLISPGDISLEDASCELFRCSLENTHLIDVVSLDPAVDPSSLCPYCDECLPETPTLHLVTLLATARSKSYTNPRPTNPMGLKAPLQTYISICQRHHFESTKLPQAIKRGWPVVIDFGKVKGRVENMKDRLEGIVLDDNERGLRHQSGYWKDMMKEVKKNGSRAAVGVAGQFSSFENSQAG